MLLKRGQLANAYASTIHCFCFIYAISRWIMNGQQPMPLLDLLVRELIYCHSDSFFVWSVVTCLLKYQTNFPS